MANVLLCECGCGEPAVYAARHCPCGYSIEHRGYSTPCWIYKSHRHTAAKSPYNQILVNGVRRAAHRVMYELERGPIPDGLVLDHLCEEKWCIRPDHLEPVTQAENVRRFHRKRPKRLSELEIREIRTAAEGYGTGIVLAAKYGVHESLISQIRSHKIYRGL